MIARKPGFDLSLATGTGARTGRTAAALAAAGTLAVATFAGLPEAEARRGPLTGQPAVRNKQELRDGRFELSPTFEMSVAADYKHTLAGGLKLEYHISDTLSFGAAGFFGTSIDTALTEQIRESLPPETPPPGDPTPTQAQFDNHLNTTPIHGAVHATLTPWFGKMSLFGKSFIDYDVYIKGGFGFAVLQNEFGQDFCDPVADGMDAAGMPIFNDPRNDCPYNSGFSPGLMLGGGIHMFMSRWLALDLSFHNYLYNDNPSGLDFDADGKVNGDDRRFLSHLFFGIGFSVFLPTTVDISP